MLEKRAHLLAALVAVALVAGVLAGGRIYAGRLAGQDVQAFTGSRSDQKTLGRLFQLAALQDPELLPLYGSSDMIHHLGPYTAPRFFDRYPTGFGVFGVARDGASALTILQSLAAVGPELRGKQVAVSLSPTWAVFRIAQNRDYYRGNFSAQHASALTFSTDLSLALRQQVARRMLDFPETLDRRPLTRFALESLAARSPLGTALYLAAWPLGKVQDVVFDLQDSWETIRLLHQPGLDLTVRRQPTRLDWASLRATAERETVSRTQGSPYGFEAGVLEAAGGRIMTPEGVTSGPEFVQLIDQAVAWRDLQLLLRTLDELGARPLLLSQPLKGSYFSAQGIPFEARQAYYERLDAELRSYPWPSATFSDYDGDDYFVLDARSHLSQKAWLLWDQVLDGFYHQTTGR